MYDMEDDRSYLENMFELGDPIEDENKEDSKDLAEKIQIVK